MYIVHCPTFYMATHRRQLILSVKIDSTTLNEYTKAKKAHPEKTFILTTQNNENLSKIVSGGQPSFEAVITTKEGYAKASYFVAIDMKNINEYFVTFLENSYEEASLFLM